MSILIKGMEMPKDGRITLQIGADGAVYKVISCAIIAEKYEKNLEVVELPPHGRLIDADALKQKKKHSNEFAENIVSVAEIDWMPTIIEEEGIEDG